MSKFRFYDQLDHPCLIITDWRYYLDNRQEIKESANFTEEGLELHFDNDKDRLAFYLRWN
jgi:hypothetical protein